MQEVCLKHSSLLTDHQRIIGMSSELPLDCTHRIAADRHALPGKYHCIGRFEPSVQGGWSFSLWVRKFVGQSLCGMTIHGRCLQKYQRRVQKNISRVLLTKAHILKSSAKLQERPSVAPLEEHRFGRLSNVPWIPTLER